MADLLDEFMDGIDECVNEVPATVAIPKNPVIQPVRVEDQGIQMSPRRPTESGPVDKRKGKWTRGSQITYESAGEGITIIFKCPYLEGCPNPVLQVESRFENSSIMNPAIRSHLFECLRLKKNMTKQKFHDENNLKSKIYLRLFEVYIYIFPLFFFILASLSTGCSMDS